MRHGFTESRGIGFVLGLLLGGQLLACAAATPKGPGFGPDKGAVPQSIASVKIAGDVAVEVRTCVVPNGTIQQPCWAYQTQGLAHHGHADLALTLGREFNEAEKAFPRDIIKLLETLTSQVIQGHRFEAWDKLGYPEGLLGRKDLTGVLVVPALLPGGVPRDRPVLSLLLVTSDELQVAVAFGVPRLSGMLGMQQRFFPTAIFVDRKRRSLCSMKELRASLPARAGHQLWLSGANVWNEAVIEQLTPVKGPTPLPDAKATVKGTVILRLTPQAGVEMDRALDKAGKDSVVTLLMPPAEDADGRLVWVPEQSAPAVITDVQLRPKRLAGNYLVLLNSEAKERGGYMIEDGFTISLPPAEWRVLRKAIATRLAYRMQGDSGTYGFEIRWAASDFPRAPGSGIVPPTP
jgi:hypothetical protein